MVAPTALFALTLLGTDALTFEPAQFPSGQELVAEMETAFAKIDDYQCRVRAQITGKTESKTFEGTFSFRRPRQVLFKSGPAGVVFRRDGHIRGWFLTRLFGHEHKPEDKILRDPRGRRLDGYILGDVINEMREWLTGGASASVSAAPEPSSGLNLEMAPKVGPVSRRVYVVDMISRLPVAWSTFEGDSKVEDVACRDLKVNVGLPDSAFR